MPMRRGAARRAPRHCARAGVGARRPRGADVRQPHRVPRDLPRLRLARRGRGADQHRLDGAADRVLAGRQRGAAAGDRGRVRRAARRRRTCRARAQAIWVVGGEGAARCRAVPTHRAAGLCRAGAAAPSPPAAGRSPAIRSPSSTPPAPPARRRACSARTRSTTGGACNSARHPRRRRRRRALHDAAAVPHQRAQHLRAGRGRRLPAWCSSRASRPPASGRRCAPRGATVVYLLGAMVPILLAQPDGARRARPPRAHRPRPRRAGRGRRGVPRAHRRARCSKATARPRPTSSSRPRPTRRAAA